MTATSQAMDERTAADRVEGPSGLGGWLILPAIGLIVTPFRLMAYLLTDLLPIFQDGSWDFLTTPGTEAYHPMWAPVILFELAGNLFFVVMAVVLIFLFFTKSHRFPRLMIVFLLSNLAFVFGDYALANTIPFVANMEADAEVYKEMARGIGGVAIWVPYFLVSKRVKNTFVKPGVDRGTLEAFD